MAYSSYNYSAYKAPDAEIQLEKIGDLLNQTVEEAAVGDEWCVIPAKWFEKWRKHTGYARPGEAAQSGGGPSPGSIGIDKLVKDLGDGFTKSDIQELKKDSVIGTHIEVVPKQAFELLKSWYYLGTWSKPVVRRVVTVVNEGVESKQVELYPATFRVSVCGNDGEPRTAKHLLQVDRQMANSELLPKSIDLVEERYANEADETRRRIWYSNDSNVWVLLGTAAANGSSVELEEGIPEHLHELPKVFSVPKVYLMVESQKDGHWLRSSENRVALVDAYRAALTATADVPDAEWRAGLKAGDFCDYYDTCEEPHPTTTTPDADDDVDDAEAEAEVKPERKPRWREAKVLGCDDNGHLTIQWRGVPLSSFEVKRDDKNLAKPYAHARDWRAQLRTKTKVEIHLDGLALSDGVLPDDCAPVYRKGTCYFYYIPKHKEWWLGDHIRQRHGYITAELDAPCINPTQIPVDKWSYYDPTLVSRSYYSTHSGWVDQTTPLTVEAVDPPVDGSRWPESVRLSGHTKYQKDKMGLWKRTHWIMGDVHRIDRKQGKLEVALKLQRTYLETVTDVIRGIDLFGDQVCEPGTHLVVKKRAKSTWNRNIEGEGDGESGIVGLRNLGNTCYMNSMLQCLNAASPLRHFFADNSFESQINTKNALGTGGQLAQAYGKLVQDMWAGQFKVVAPSEFKETIGQFAPAFAGFNQQDSIELYDYLLDNLHEDLNRVINKPYVENVDDEGQTDLELAEESWRRYKLRNDSIIVDQMMGQFRSHLTCPKDCCKHTSRKYDSFSSVSVPLPAKAHKGISVTVIRAGLDQDNYEVKVNVGKKSSSLDLVKAVCSKVGCGLNPSNTVLVELLYGKVYRTYYSPCFEAKEIEVVDAIQDNDILCLYEVPAQTMKSDDGGMVADSDDDDDFYGGRRRYRSNSHFNLSLGVDFVGHMVPVQQMKRCLSPKYSQDVFDSMGHLRVMQFDLDMTCKEAHARLWQWVSIAIGDSADPERDVYPHHAGETYAAKPEASDAPNTIDQDLGSDENKKSMAVAGTSDAAASAGSAPPYIVILSDQSNVRRAGDYWNVAAPFKILPYTDKTIRELMEEANMKKIGFVLSFDEDKVPEKMLLTSGKLNPGANAGGEDESGDLTLDRCFRQFSTREQLGKMDTWYCPKCKDHVQAFKKMDLWKVPKVLTVHLKRFQYDNGYFREKLDVPVLYPQQINLKDYVIGPQAKFPLNYELFAVSNHIGYGIGGGHYTAYANVNGQWNLFNDASISKVEPKDVQTDEAYVLFYRLLEDEDENDGSGGGGGGGGGGGVVSESSGGDGDGGGTASATSSGGGADEGIGDGQLS